eukprot:TRINITY_DN29295_c0_g2_i1.p1 TRINITY_DN29295_c0_g2~~TRINITY_DN29295_c0_g2_i1.p1  ORF type:complete len:476 (+),score=79.37 TRINITY_DN29295_c0_g2_i1:45-1472(+)
MNKTRASKEAAAAEAFAKSLPDGLVMLRLMGSGSHGSVAAVRWSSSMSSKKKPFALKRVAGVFDEPVLALRTIREIRILAHFRHPNILSIDAATLHGSDAFIRMPLLDGTLSDVVKKGPLDNLEVQSTFYQILCGLLCLHTAHVLHRDLKPCNVLVSLDGAVQLGDLGMARSMDVPGDTQDAPELTEYVVTRWYRAPEVVLSASKYTYAVDIWSAGCILAEIILGWPLFRGRDPLDQLKCILDQMGVLSHKDVEWVEKPSPAWTFLQHSTGGKFSESAGLALQPLRAKIFAALEQQSEEKESLMDLLAGMLCFSPEKRMPAAVCLMHTYLSRAAAADSVGAARTAAEAQPMDWSFDRQLCFDSKGRARPFCLKSFRAALAAACEAVTQGHQAKITQRTSGDRRVEPQSAGCRHASSSPQRNLDLLANSQSIQCGATRATSAKGRTVPQGRAGTRSVSAVQRGTSRLRRFLTSLAA